MKLVCHTKGTLLAEREFRLPIIFSNGVTESDWDEICIALRRRLGERPIEVSVVGTDGGARVHTISVLS